MKENLGVDVSNVYIGFVQMLLAARVPLDDPNLWFFFQKQRFECLWFIHTDVYLIESLREEVDCAS